MHLLHALVTLYAKRTAKRMHSRCIPNIQRNVKLAKLDHDIAIAQIGSSWPTTAHMKA